VRVSSTAKERDKIAPRRRDVPPHWAPCRRCPYRRRDPDGAVHNAGVAQAREEWRILATKFDYFYIVRYIPNSDPTTHPRYVPPRIIENVRRRT
jgi:hypothetical protein